jgi:hypothetical protein
MCEKETITFDEIVKSANLLISWGFARIINPLKPNNIFVLTPNVGHISKFVQDKFSAKFNGRSLTHTIQTMFGNGPVSFS